MCIRYVVQYAYDMMFVLLTFELWACLRSCLVRRAHGKEQYDAPPPGHRAPIPLHTQAD